jgi:hypothetical protein
MVRTLLCANVQPRGKHHARPAPSRNRPEKLTSLNDRIAEFIADRLPADEAPVELLCLDHNGTYVLPFPCRRVADSWRNFATGEQIEAEVAGWRRRER